MISENNWLIWNGYVICMFPKKSFCSYDFFISHLPFGLGQVEITKKKVLFFVHNLLKGSTTNQKNARNIKSTKNVCLVLKKWKSIIRRHLQAQSCEKNYQKSTNQNEKICLVPQKWNGNLFLVSPNQYGVQ
jgi:hypothetical protein